MSLRLQKWLAERGFGSRRQMEGWIEAGRVLVDGKVAKLGTSASALHNTQADVSLTAAISVPLLSVIVTAPVTDNTR